ncbi:MAG: efflux RND transporter periplasmic adaptor subunit [Phycisphaerales bacterium]|nr:MAG: efflux RND transporter periplasmic adaptor subunit [Phycisphaerales bacterium]
MTTYRRQQRLTLWLLFMPLGLFVGTVTGCDDPEAGGSSVTEEKKVPVRVAAVALQTMRETVRGIGTLRAAETVEIKPEIDGFIREIHFTEGGSVNKDELLVSIDDRKLKHQLEATKAALQMAQVRFTDAQRRLKRMQDLVTQAAADQDELDQIETEFLAAKAEVERMQAETELVQARLDDTQLRAPFSGVISERSVDVGDYVQTGSHLATLHRVSQMEIAFSLPERFMGRTKMNQPVAVSVGAFPGRVFAGGVYFVSPQIDETTRDFLVKATVENPEGLLKPGAFGTAVVTIDVREGVCVVPEKALVATREGYIIFVVDEQTARRREVQVGLRETGTAEIRSGLGPGELVVTEGQLSVSDGTAVKLLQGEGEATAQGTPSSPSRSERRP